MSETFKFDENGGVTFRSEGNNKIYMLQSKVNALKIDLNKKVNNNIWKI